MRALILGVATLSFGCAAQVTSGAAWSGDQTPRVPVTAGLTMQALRTSNIVVGARATSMFNEGIALRSGMLHTGYDFVSEESRWAIEPGVDIGAGVPVKPIDGLSGLVFDGIGGYAGTSANLRLRVLGTGDKRPGFNVAFGFVELVFNPRAGLWMPPEGSLRAPLYVESSLEVGVRFGFGSDVASRMQGIPPNKKEAPAYDSEESSGRDPR